MPGSAHLLLISSTLLMLTIAGAVGCGGSGSTEGYASLAQGLKAAALSGRQFDALDRSSDLSEAQRASLTAFCALTHELLANGDGYKVSASAYYISMIKTTAEERLPAGSTQAVSAAVERMDSLYGLRSFEPKMARRYARACYR